MFIYINGRRVWVELQAADGGGNDGSADKDLPADALKSFERLLERHGNNAGAVAQLLYNDNKELRDKNQALRDKAPADGALVLTGADALLWASYTALGKPDEVKQGLDERAQLQGKLAAQERETLLRNVADVAYPGKATVLAQLDRMAKAEGHALTFDVRETTIDGKQSKVAYVKDGDKDYLPLTEYALTNWADFLPALTPAQGNGTQQQGTRYLAQHAGGGGGGKVDPVAEYIAKQEASRAAEKSPLLK